MDLGIALWPNHTKMFYNGVLHKDPYFLLESLLGATKEYGRATK